MTVSEREESGVAVLSEKNSVKPVQASDSLSSATQIFAAGSDITYRKAIGSESFFGYCKRSVAELKTVKFAMASFVINTLRRRYQRSMLGFAWSMLNPILTMTVMTVVFSILFHRPLKEFCIYIFTGLTPWSFITESLNQGCTAIVGAEGFLRKVYIPKLFFPITSTATEAVNFVLSLAALFCIGIFIGLPITPNLLLVPFAIALTCIFAFGLSIIVSVATVYFRDLTHLIRVILLSLFYLMPVLYHEKDVPEKYMQFIYWNPFYHFIRLFRALMCDPPRVPHFHEWFIAGALAVGSVIIGLFILYKREKDLVFRL